MQRSAPAWTAVGAVVLAALIAVDTGLGVPIAGTLAIAPLVTVLAASPRPTLLVGSAATVASPILSLHDGADAMTAVVRTIAVAAASALAVLAARRFESEHELLGHVSRVAEVAQLAVLTPVPASAGPYALASVYVSASKEALIGGDLYGVVDTPFGLRVMVGDVRGKGLDAVSLAATTLTTFRELAGSAGDLRDIAARLDRRLSPGLGVEDFVTAVFAGLTADGKVELVNCGHPPPLVLRGATLSWLETGSPTAPLGLEPEPALQRYTLQPGERLLFYTDGLVEARARTGGFIDLDRVLCGVGAAPMDSALAGVLRRVREQAGDEHRDDIALLLAEYAPAAAHEQGRGSDG